MYVLYMRSVYWLTLPQWKHTNYAGAPNLQQPFNMLHCSLLQTLNIIVEGSNDPITAHPLLIYMGMVWFTSNTVLTFSNVNITNTTTVCNV